MHISHDARKGIRKSHFLKKYNHMSNFETNLAKGVTKKPKKLNSLRFILI